MRSKLIGAVMGVIVAVLAQGADSPAALREALYATSNLRGKTDDVGAYRMARHRIGMQLKKCQNGDAIWREWNEEFLRFIAHSPDTRDVWLEEGGVELLMSGSDGSTCTSTNCWLAAADYSRRVLGLRRAAYAEWTAQNQGRGASGTFELEAAPAYREAWNRLAVADRAVEPALYALTNLFPAAILPRLSTDEGAAFYSNVLRRAELCP